MELLSLKSQIESKKLSLNKYVFVSEDNFLPLQYAKEISKLLSKTLVFVDNFVVSEYAVFDVVEDSNEYVCLCDSFNDSELPDNSIVICKSTNYTPTGVVNFPKVETWMRLEYLKSKLPSLSEKAIEFLNSTYQDMFCLQNEIDKLAIFDKSIQSNMFDLFKKENQFSNESKSIFDIINLILTKQFSVLNLTQTDLYNKISSGIGFLQVFYKSVKNVLLVSCGKNMSAEDLGLKPNQYYAIRHLCGFYTVRSLTKILQKIIELDSMVKSGKVDDSIVIEYVLCYCGSLE